MEDGEEDNSKNRYGKVIAEPKELITILKKSFIGVVLDEGENDEASFGVVEGFQEE